MWITRVSINNPVFATMVMVALCVLGLFSYAKLGVEQMPDISFPGAWMQVQYPGAAPEALERETSAHQQGEGEVHADRGVRVDPGLQFLGQQGGG